MTTAVSAGRPLADTVTVVPTVPLPGASETSALLTSTFEDLMTITDAAQPLTQIRVLVEKAVHGRSEILRHSAQRAAGLAGKRSQSLGCRLGCRGGEFQLPADPKVVGSLNRRVGPQDGGFRRIAASSDAAERVRSAHPGCIATGGRWLRPDRAGAEECEGKGDMDGVPRAHEGILVFGFAAAWMPLARLCANGWQWVRTVGGITGLG